MIFNLSSEIVTLQTELSCKRKNSKIDTSSVEVRAKGEFTARKAVSYLVKDIYLVYKVEGKTLNVEKNV